VIDEGAVIVPGLHVPSETLWRGSPVKQSKILTFYDAGRQKLFIVGMNEQP